MEMYEMLLTWHIFFLILVVLAVPTMVIWQFNLFSKLIRDSLMLIVTILGQIVLLTILASGTYISAYSWIMIYVCLGFSFGVIIPKSVKNIYRGLTRK